MFLGVVGGLGVAWAVRGLLYGVSPWDPLTFVGVPAAVLAVALLAAWGPPRRAARLDPMTAFRSDSG